MKQRKKLLAVIVMALALVLQPISAFAAPTRKNCDSKPKNGNDFISIKGEFLSDSKESLLKRVNEIRLEACKEGIVNPATGKKLTMKDYVPIKWSAQLEMIAQQRAAEATVSQAHQRPNGERCFTVEYNGYKSWGEVLAWNYSGMQQGIEQWYEEKADWVYNTGGVTGHYTAMINPENTYIGLGGFDPKNGDWICVAGEFMSDDTLNYMQQYYGAGPVDESKIGVSGEYYQVIEVPSSNLTAKLSSCTVKKGATKKLRVQMTYKTKNYYGYEKTIKGIGYGVKSWKSSKKSVATVSKSGVVTAKKRGTTTISAVTAGGKKVSCKVTVK